MRSAVGRWCLSVAAALALLYAVPISMASAQPHRVGAELWGQLEPNAGMIILEGSSRKYPYIDA
ncbi:MAG: hypothetical protein JRG70_15515, partial [Deltaproteobacteria bacterium]|nr:hypothetical protein [Deltaproteobacteria bacterium]